ncbi:MAG: hypothetical protein WAM72_09845 [Xanthobacteraceae bacterium]
MAAGELQLPFGIDAAHITRTKLADAAQAPGKPLCGEYGLAPISCSQIVAFDDNFADFAAVDWLACFIPD